MNPVRQAIQTDDIRPLGAADAHPGGDVVLTVKGLTVDVPRNATRLVSDADLVLTRGATLGLVGESGSGKTTLTKAIAGLLPESLRVASGQVAVGGRDVLALSARERRAFVPTKVAVIFQHPTTALNPRLSVGAHLLAAIGSGEGLSRRERVYRAVELLDQMEIPDAARRLAFYPHELSGGQCQRVLIAMAMARNPEVLIADEPTTALDVSVQARVLDRVDELRRERGLALLLVSHDIGLIADRSDRIAVMDGGRIVETGPTRALLARPSSVRLQALIASRQLGTSDEAGRLTSQNVDVDAHAVLRHFPNRAGGRSGPVRAVDGVSFSIESGRAFGIVGESGSGKTTLARILAGLDRAHRGGADCRRCRPDNAPGRAATCVAPRGPVPLSGHHSVPRPTHGRGPSRQPALAVISGPPEPL